MSLYTIVLARLPGSVCYRTVDLMYLNDFAQGLTPLDMSRADEFASLRSSAADLGVSIGRSVRYHSRQTVVRGQRLHFSEWGEPGAPELVLLHGSNQSSHSWDLVSAHFADRYHIFALDQRGHGDSEWSRELDYSLDAMAQDARAFIDAHALSSPVVFGHSMGGRVALQLAPTAPEVAHALVIVDSGPELSAAGGKMIRNFVSKNIEFDDFEQFLDNVTKYDKFRSREHIARTAKYNLLQRADGKFISKNDHRRVETPPTALTLADVAAIDRPVLVVRGGQSNVLEPDAAERFVAALPAGELVTVPDCAHNVHSQNTLGFIAATTPFLEHHCAKRAE